MVSTAATSHKALVRRFWEEVWNQGNLDAVPELLTEDTTGYIAGKPDIQGIDGERAFVRMYRTAFPDLHYLIEDEVVEGDTVVTRWTVTGTHRGELQGIPPTGKKIKLSGTTMMRVRNGKVADNWTDFDALGMLQQIGALPAPDGPVTA